MIGHWPRTLLRHQVLRCAEAVSQRALSHAYCCSVSPSKACLAAAELPCSCLRPVCFSTATERCRAVLCSLCTRATRRQPKTWNGCATSSTEVRLYCCWADAGPTHDPHRYCSVCVNVHHVLVVPIIGSIVHQGMWTSYSTFGAARSRCTLPWQTLSLMLDKF